MAKQDKKLKRAVSLAKQQGWRFKDENDTSKHTKAYSPDKKTIVTISSSSISRRGLENVLSEFKRGGLRRMKG